MTTYTPRLRPMVPASHERWTAVSRVPEHAVGRPQFSDQSDDEQIEWLLRAITSPGADQNQRRYDLESLADIVTRNQLAGYGKAPIDGDSHDPDCSVCRGKYEDVFDGHPYTYAPEEKTA